MLIKSTCLLFNMKSDNRILIWKNKIIISKIKIIKMKVSEEETNEIFNKLKSKKGNNVIFNLYVYIYIF